MESQTCCCSNTFHHFLWYPSHENLMSLQALGEGCSRGKKQLSAKPFSFKFNLVLETERKCSMELAFRGVQCQQPLSLSLSISATLHMFSESVTFQVLKFKQKQMHTRKMTWWQENKETLSLHVTDFFFRNAQPRNGPVTRSKNHQLQT